MIVARQINLVAAIGQIRTAQFDGKDHTVVPVVALVEGVIQAMNAPAPELVPTAAFSIAPSGWDGRPVFLGHPMNGNDTISGNSPTVLASSFGRIFNTEVKKDRLLMEAWLDSERAKTVGVEATNTIERINSGKTVEISVGAFVIMEDKKGTWNNQPYDGVWDVIIPDHLALLPEGATGACSVAMGCGTPRVARSYKVTDKGLKEIVMTVPKKPRSMRQRFSELFRGLLSQDMSDVEVREELSDALRAKESMLDWIEAVYPDHVVYCVYENGSQKWYQRDYTVDKSDNFTVADTRTEVEENRTWDPVTAEGKKTSTCSCGKTSDPSQSSTSGSAPVAAKSSEGDKSMTKAERIAALAANPHSPIKSKAALEACSDDELQGVENVAKQAKDAADEKVKAEAEAQEKIKAEADVKAKADAEGKMTVNQQGKPPTEEEWLKTAPESIRTLVTDAKEREEAERTKLVTSLKAAQKEFTEDELKKMSVKELTRLSRLAGAAEVDFSGRGLPVNTDSDVYLNPPDSYRMARENRQKGKVN